MAWQKGLLEGDVSDYIWEGQWAALTAYTANDCVYNDGSSYVCFLGHTSSAAGAAGDEPGTGANWTTYWDVLVLGTDATRFARAEAKLDLSGAAQSTVIIFHTTRACTIKKITFLYTEASSEDAGVAVYVGKESDVDYYADGHDIAAGLSEVTKAIWYEYDLTPLQTDVAAGDTVFCSTPVGGKTGTGEILVCVEYTVN